MSDYTRYLLASAGVPATDRDIEVIDATGYPYEVCQVLAFFSAKGDCIHVQPATKHAQRPNSIEHGRTITQPSICDLEGG